MTSRRGYRRRRNNNGSSVISAIFPGINPAPYQSSNQQYPFPQYMSGTGGGYPTGSSTSGLSTILGFSQSDYRPLIEKGIICCNGLKLVGKLGYFILKNSDGTELVQIDGEGMYKYHFFRSNYDTDEDGALIILDEGSL